LSVHRWAQFRDIDGRVAAIIADQAHRMDGTALVWS
jgi:hypothetical protein